MTTRARAFLRCPHCDAAAIVRSSVSHNNLLRESTLQCRNAMCGHTFTAYTEIVRTISPSACPSDDILLPVSSAAEKAAFKAKLAEQQVAVKVS
ncbi:ogr/Delta-like zinc finger family protein [Xanthomonas oryzae pv. oryzicola]|uniref:ogr/Delta-like zinc finger family protein n=1 Tax=Xanthomonas oryzae TaxID=347 RepID=UPI000519AE50|nr:ogr/Delta-like zinc finger family protein [Xanthomonas oryzae]AKO06212.1 transcriptional regulator [Xanthomonas oryzae pv. oryzicola]AKO10126.1 transcriptional regulator [Xanthomonas oryzae pv. oryzicola]OWB30493.1 transcriptional regulator [Xanthomonas oryzae pv. oryzicola]